RCQLRRGFLDTQLDTAAVVHIQYLHLHHLAFFQVVADAVDALFGDLGNVHQTVSTRQNVHERTEIDDLGHLAIVDPAHFRLGHDTLDLGLGHVGSVGILTIDADSAVVLDVDLGTGFFTDLANDRTTLADNITDLLGVDLHGHIDRCLFRHLATGCTDDLVHFAENVQTAFACLIQRDFHDLFGDTGDLDIHLQRSNAIGSTSHLEVHVAQVIFITQNIGQHREAIAFLHQTHGNTGHRRLHRHTGIHQRQTGATHRSHGRRTIGFRDFRHHTNGIGEF